MKYQICQMMAIVLILLIAGKTNADVIAYDDMESANYFFTGITESSLDPLPLFGQPTIEGNVLTFENPTFDIATSNSTEFIDGRMTVTVTAKDDQPITSFSLLESGDFEIIGQGSVAVGGIAFATAGTSTYQGQFQFDANQESTDTWSRKLDIFFDTPVTAFSLVMDNQLFANSLAGSSSSIGKNSVSLKLNTIPEPSTAILLLGCSMFVLRRRR